MAGYVLGMAHTDQINAVSLAWTLPDDHAVTDSERRTLQAFTGWGALAPAFAQHPTAGTWADTADQLEGIVPGAALRAAAEQVDTSFFTPRPVVSAVFALLSATGFTGGRVLEPGCGAGAFMTAAPEDIDIEWTGVEVDPTSARICALLNPNATVLVGKLENTPLRDGHYDAVIGNVPFSSARVYASGTSDVLHNYFLRRSVEAVRPGGYVILVTSRHSIDSTTGFLARIRSVEDAAFIGAVRLPSGAFAESGTEVVTDIVVIRRNDPTLILPAYDGPADVEVEHELDWRRYRVAKEVDRRTVITEPEKPGADVAQPAVVSRYWEANPEHVAGEMRSTNFARNPLVVRSEEPAIDIPRAVHALATKLPPMSDRIDPTAPVDDIPLVDAEGRKEGSFQMVDGTLHRVESGKLAPIRSNRELSALIDLRDLALQLLELESDVQTPDAEIAPLRQRTLQAYESYVRRFGNLNRGTLVEGKIDEETGLPALSWRRPAMGGFRKDPDAPLVMASEEFDQETGVAGPAPILRYRVNRAPRRVERTEKPAEALAISLGETGIVDLDRIAGLLSLGSADAALTALGDLVHVVGGRAIPAAEYLSGNVRQKLADARQRLNAGDERAARDIAALEEVRPADLGPLEISVNLGSPLVSTDDVSSFLREVLGVSWPDVHHEVSRGVWEVSDVTSSAAAQAQYATPDTTPAYLVECALNARLPEVTDRVWNPDRGQYVQVRNLQKSAAANEKMELIRDRFSTWVWEDEERCTRICADYNRRFNSHVRRTHTGTGLTFPGLSGDVTPWPHQRAIVERAVSSARIMIGHPVGFGKTKSAVMIARTLRQFGLARKPVIVVPNHLLDQISREAQQTFPTGRFLIASKDDLARDSRRLFAARCATGEWDAVIMTHSSFTMIPVHPDAEKSWLDDQKLALEWAMQTTQGGRKDKGPKAIARAIRALDGRVAKLRDGISDRDAIWYDQLGIDYIIYDEAHLARRLDTGSTVRDNGMPSGSSKRATDLLVKIETLADRRPVGAPVCALMTGTPWSNTLAETWVWQRFLQPDLLEELDVRAFDAWVSQFVKYDTSIEVAPDGGGFRMQRRPVGIVNAPELKTLLGQVADILDPDDLDVVRPDRVSQTIVVPPTPLQREYVRDLAERADAIRAKTAAKRAGANGGEVDDSMLLVCNDGRKVALDPRLVGIAERSSKLDRLAELIAEAHHENADRTFGGHPTPGALQLVFLDLGTPKPDDSAAYGRLRRALVDRGVPAERVRFVHDARTDKARAALFASCRDGSVSVLVGSTSKVGMGTNVQTRLTHLWHADAPWLPSDVVQRDGRAIRPGNLSGTVTVTRVVTEGTFDAFIWQALERKSRSFDALTASGSTAREIEDVSAATVDYGAIKALASGNPLLLDQAKARAEVKRLQLMRSVHFQSARKAEQAAKQLDERAGLLRRRAQSATLALPQVSPSASETDRQMLENAARDWLDKDKPAWSRRATAPFRGIEITARFEGSQFHSVNIDYRCRTLFSIPVSGKLIRRGAVALSSAIAREADTLIDSIEQRIADWERNADELTRAAEESRAVAAADVFPDEARLQQAIARLAEIDVLIDAAAQPAAAAA